MMWKCVRNKVVVSSQESSLISLFVILKYSIKISFHCFLWVFVKIANTMHICTLFYLKLELVLWSFHLVLERYRPLWFGLFETSSFNLTCILLSIACLEEIMQCRILTFLLWHILVSLTFNLSFYFIVTVCAGNGDAINQCPEHQVDN